MVFALHESVVRCANDLKLLLKLLHLLLKLFVCKHPTTPTTPTTPLLVSHVNLVRVELPRQGSVRKFDHAGVRLSGR